MKHGMLAIIVASVLAFAIFSAGCGGGASTPNANLPGIWSGTYTSASRSLAIASTGHTRVIAPTSVNIEFVQTGTAITGTAEVNSSGQVGFGPISGTNNGSTITATINYTASDLVTSTVTISGNNLTGTYVHTLNGVSIDNGTVSLTKSSLTSTANIAGTYAGTSLKDAAGSTAKPLSFTVVQTGNSITLTGVGGNAFTGTGTVVGKTMEAHLTITGTSDTLDIVGTVNGSSITGTTYQPGTNSGNNGVAQTGTFTVTAGT